MEVHLIELYNLSGGHAGACRKSPNDASWETQSAIDLVGQFLHHSRPLLSHAVSLSDGGHEIIIHFDGIST